MNFYWKTLTLAFPFLLVGCASAWIISSNESGGTIGYKALTNKSATKAIQKVIPCSNYDVISDNPYSVSSQYTEYAPVSTTQTTNYQIYDSRGRNWGSATAQTQDTQYVPVTKTYTSGWREMTYRCRSSLVSSEQLPPRHLTSDDGQSHSCTYQCQLKGANNQLPAGMDVSDCFHKVCGDP